MNKDQEVYTLEELTLVANKIADAIEKMCESLQYMNHRIETLERQQTQGEHDEWAKDRTIQ